MTKWASGQNEYSSFLGLKNTGFGQWVDRTFSKKKTDQDAQYTHTLFQQKDNNQSNISENTRKISCIRILCFLDYKAA